MHVSYQPKRHPNLDAAHATYCALQEIQQHGSIHSVSEHPETATLSQLLVANYDGSQVFRTSPCKNFRHSIVMFAAAWLWAIRRAPPGTLKESLFLWELRLTPVRCR
jgi:hypothetical protein